MTKYESINGSATSDSVFPPPYPVPSVFVTGGTGFVGSAIIRAIVDRHPNTRITLYDTDITPSLLVSRGLDSPQITPIRGDILSVSSLVSALTKDAIPPSAIVHTAGYVPPLSERYARRMEEKAWHVNLEGTRTVLKAAKLAGVKAFVYTSTCCVVIDDVQGGKAEYANIDERWPVVTPGTASIYAESKAAAEDLVLRTNGAETAITEDGLDSHSVLGHSSALQSEKSEAKHSLLTCSIRPAVIYGEYDHQLLPSIISCIADKYESPYRVGSGLNLWDTVYVGNVADAHVLAVENLLAHIDYNSAQQRSDTSGNSEQDSSKPALPSAAGEAFFIQNNEPVPFRDFSLIVWKQYNGHIPPFTVPIPIALAWFLGLVMEIITWFTGTPATLSRGSVNDATAVRYASGDKARRILGYVPRVHMGDGIRRGVEEIKTRKMVKESSKRG